MDFITMRDLLNEHFAKMVKDVKQLFIVQVDKDEMYNLYLDSFPAGTNEIFRERREHDCSCCRGFIKNIGNVVAIKNGQIETIWDFETNDTTYAPVLKTMAEYIKDKQITDVYKSIESKIGCHHNFEIMEKVGQHRWDHFFLELDNRFTCRSFDKGELQNKFRTSRDVFKRALDEFTLDSLDTVLDLIATNSLYKGPEWKVVLETFRGHKVNYDKLDSDAAKNIYAWEQSVEVPETVSRLKNTSMGTLLIDISNGRSLDEAVRAYETITAPSNYKRSKPIFTQKMLDDARANIEKLGYTDALPRRHANLDDISINDILFANKDAAPRIQGASNVFDELSVLAKGNSAKKFSKVEEIPIDKFISDVIPTVSSIEAYLENKHVGNMVSLIAPINNNVKSMFKWGNNFTWAYAGNMTDSMKDRVKNAGGRVDGDLRFSIQWNEDGKDNCDLDAHCMEMFKHGGKEEIYYSHKRSSATKGQLDVDIINPAGEIAVENITWDDRSTMKPGKYKFFVHQFSGSVKNGFRAEIEFDGNICTFDYPHGMRSKQNVDVATVTLDENGNFTIETHLDSDQTSKKIWNVDSNQFVPVSVVCYSPNFWSTAATNVGHQHVFFMLKNCINEETPSGIFNEFLVQDLYQHRHVMEALGNKMRVEQTNDQLSGIGFALDKRAELIVKVTGATERILKIKF